jgi:cysteinyl-tRNA synthetase
MHNGLLKMGHSKMAGSVGNVVNVLDLLQKHSPETVRFLLLGTHYRSPIEWTDDRLAEVKRALDTFYRFFERYERITAESFYSLQAPRTEQEHKKAKDPSGQVLEGELLYEGFLALMDDDFNTGGAVGKLFELVTQLNRFADTHRDFSDDEARKGLPFTNFKRGVVVLRELSQILGLFHEPPATAGAANDQLVAGLIQLLIDLRQEARKAKNFAMSDSIRARLGQLGVTLEDRPGGTGWRLS